MKALYVDGKTLFHRLSPDLKLAMLALAAVLLFLTRDASLLALATIATIGAYASLRQPFRNAIRPLRPILLTILVVGAFHLVLTSAEEAIVTVLRLSTLMFFAATVTATTRIEAFIDTITRAVRPLERVLPVRAADIGLAVGLVVRFVPEVLLRYGAIREAHKARGLKLSAVTLLGPLIVLTLKDADNIADAIDARGIRRQDNRRGTSRARRDPTDPRTAP